MWWRRKPASEEPRSTPDDGRQVRLRRTHPIEAVTLQFGDWSPVVGDEPGQVYEDEIDPDWRDHETAAETGGPDRAADPTAPDSDAQDGDR